MVHLIHSHVVSLTTGKGGGVSMSFLLWTILSSMFSGNGLWVAEEEEEEEEKEEEEKGRGERGGGGVCKDEEKGERNNED